MRTAVLFIVSIFVFFVSNAQFGPEQIISLNNNNAGNVLPMDWDNDGFVDVVSGAYGKVVWHKNIDGNGTFGQEQIIANTNGGAYQFVDFDNDTDLDILYGYVVPPSSYRIVWIENEDGVGAYGPEQLIVEGESTFNMRVADLDNDSDEDILVVHNLNSFQEELVWYENMDGQGTFSSEHYIATDYFSGHPIIIDDIDEDGDNDIIACTWDLLPGKIDLYRNDGAGDFGTAENLFQFDSFVSDTYKAEKLIITDLNNDGIKDLLINAGHDEFLNRIIWLEGIDESPTFNESEIIYNYETELYLSSMEPHDIDNDGDQDLLLGFSMGNSYGNFSYMLNVDGFGSFGDIVIVDETIVRTGEVTAADLDHDNDLDAIVCSAFAQRLSWYENMGNLGVGNATMLTSTLYPNPTNGKLYINSSEKVSFVTILNTYGAIVYEEDNPVEIDLSTYPTGIYFVKLTTISGQKTAKKIIKE